MRVIASVFLASALSAIGASALAAEALPENGAARLAAYQVCHSLAVVDMGPTGSQSATECNGIVRNLDTQKSPDNLSIRCLESTSARTDGYNYSGTCVLTDGDSDKIFMSYEGVKEGQSKWFGGTGKYKDVAASGSLAVVVAPGGAPDLFAYTLNFNMTWTNKAK